MLSENILSEKERIAEYDFWKEKYKTLKSMFDSEKDDFRKK
jgi:hypothetical protein